jgi:hypothetical protein
MRRMSVIGGAALAAHGVAHRRGLQRDRLVLRWLRRSTGVGVRRTSAVALAARVAAGAGRVAAEGGVAWWAESPKTVAENLGVDPEIGLSASEVASRREVRNVNQTLREWRWVLYALRPKALGSSLCPPQPLTCAPLTQ